MFMASWILKLNFVLDGVASDKLNSYCTGECWLYQPGNPFCHFYRILEEDFHLNHSMSTASLQGIGLKFEWPEKSSTTDI
uniref:Uncharacterized protein n=1 Tax=Arion vulgaris TaxID=1028688 RepID=A0A0B7AMB9_9EUPU